MGWVTYIVLEINLFSGPHEFMPLQPQPIPARQLPPFHHYSNVLMIDDAQGLLKRRRAWRAADEMVILSRLPAGGYVIAYQTSGARASHISRWISALD
jgi:hypothetical protein